MAPSCPCALWIISVIYLFTFNIVITVKVIIVSISLYSTMDFWVSSVLFCSCLCVCFQSLLLFIRIRDVAWISHGSNQMRSLHRETVIWKYCYGQMKAASINMLIFEWDTAKINHALLLRIRMRIGSRQIERATIDALNATDHLPIKDSQSLSNFCKSHAVKQTHFHIRHAVSPHIRNFEQATVNLGLLTGNHIKFDFICIWHCCDKMLQWNTF